MKEALRVELQDLSGDFGELMGFTQDELIARLSIPEFDAGTEDDQGKLDQLDPKMVTCPHCQIEWDLREHGQG
jgi:hypothetical protein